MSDEFFDPLPSGPVAPSRRYFGRMQREVERASRAPMTPTFPGGGGSDAVGWWLAPDFDEVIFAVLTRAPGGSYVGWSWQERAPDVNGEWAIPDVMLQGDNGSQSSDVTATITEVEVAANIATFTTDEDPSGLAIGDLVTVADVDPLYNGTWLVVSTPTSTTFTARIVTPDADPVGVAGSATVAARPAGGAAFDPNGTNEFDVGQMVALARGYLSVADNQWQWLILGGGSGPGLVQLGVTGSPTTVNGCAYWPCNLLRFDAAKDGGCGTVNQSDVFATPGPCTALAAGQTWWAVRIGTVTVGSDTAPAYRTVLRADCCDCLAALPEGEEVGYDCTFQITGTSCATGSPKVTTLTFCLPMKVPYTLTVEDAPAVPCSTEVANHFFAGPATGADAVPAWRTIVTADLPDANSNVGSFGAADHTLSVTADAKGRITAISSTTIAIGSGQVSGLAAIATSGDAADLGGTLAIAHGGSGQTTAAAAFNALSPLTALGDVLYGGTSGAGTRLAGNTTTTRKYLRQTGTGSVSAAPAWDSFAAVCDDELGWADGDVIMRVSGVPTKVTPVSSTYLTDVSVASASIGTGCSISITLSKTTATHKVLP